MILATVVSLKRVKVPEMFAQKPPRLEKKAKSAVRGSEGNIGGLKALNKGKREVKEEKRTVGVCSDRIR